MTVTTYAELQSAIADTLNRTDLTAPIQDWIQFAEARFNRELRHWRMETNTTFTADARYEDLPADWLETIRMDVSGGDRLTMLSHAEMSAQRAAAENQAGEPSYYAIIGGQVELYPTPNDTYTVNHAYFGTITALSDSNTANWLLSYAPDLYMYGALLHSAPYLVEDRRIATWTALHDSALRRLQLESRKARHSGTGLKTATRAYS